MLVLSLLAVFCLSVSYSQTHYAFVEDVVIRLEPPTSANDCVKSAAGSYGDGDSFEVDTLATTIFYCGKFRSLNRYEKIYVTIESNSGDFSESSNPIFISGGFYSRHAVDYASVSDFDGENPIKVTGFVVNTKNNAVINQKTSEITYVYNAPPPAVSGVTVTDQNGNRITDDGSPIDVTAQDAFAFTASFTDVRVGDQVQIDLKSTNVPNGVTSPMVTVSSDESASSLALFLYHHARQLDIFANDNQISIGASLYDSSGVLIDTLDESSRFIMNINYIIALP